MKDIWGYCWAVERRERRVFSAKGQPQWRRNVTTVGLPSERGKASCSGMDGAGEGIEGGWEMAMKIGEVHEEISWRRVMILAWRLGRSEGAREGGDWVAKSCGSCGE